MGKIIFFVIVMLVSVGAVLVYTNSQTQNDSSQVVPTLGPTILPTQIPQQNTQQVQGSQSTVQNQNPTPTPNVISVDRFVADMATREAVIKTSKGDITMTFYPKDAPNTVFNFVKKANIGFYNNLTFHRVEDWVVQGGDPKGDGTGGGKMQTEINGHQFVEGSVGVARGSDLRISNDAQFFITKKNSDFLYTQYTNFGIVTKGMDVVNNLQIGDKILEIKIQ